MSLTEGIEHMPHRGGPMSATCFYKYVVASSVNGVSVQTRL